MNVWYNYLDIQCQIRTCNTGNAVMVNTNNVNYKIYNRTRLKQCKHIIINNSYLITKMKKCDLRNGI